MLVYFLLALIGIQLMRSIQTQPVTLEGILTYLMPYWKKGDYEDRILGIFQLFIIGCISGMQSIQTKGVMPSVLVFFFTFMSLVWLIKLLICVLEWFNEYIKTMTINIIFTVIVPILVILNLGQMDEKLEIYICLWALLMSLIIVYMELISIVLGRGMYKKASKYLVLGSASKLKSILTWFFIILLNLYTLILFIQFYIETSNYHFIETKVLNRASAVDLFYYLVVTFTTVGFGDISPHTLIAKVVTAIVALSGMVFTGIFVGCILNLKEE